jgi:hypothetical protein
MTPISIFDQYMREEPSRNCLEYSFYLFKEVVSDPILASVNIILLLSKYDVLKKKLKSGIRVSR